MTKLFTYLTTFIICLSLKIGVANAYDSSTLMNSYYELLTINNSAKRAQEWQNLLTLAHNINSTEYELLIIQQLILIAIENSDKHAKEKWQAQFNIISQKIEKKSQPIIDSLRLLQEFKSAIISSNYYQSISLGEQLLKRFERAEIKNNQAVVENKPYLVKFHVGKLHNDLGVSYFNVGDYGLALSQFVASFNIYQAINYQLGIASSLNNMSLISWAQKDYKQALNYLKQSREIFLNLNNLESYIINLSNQGIYHAYLDEHDKAIDIYRSVLQHPNSDEYPKIKINAMLAMGESFTDLKQLHNARRVINTALDFAKKINDSKSLANAKVALSEVLIAQNNNQQAITLLMAALEVYQKKGLKHDQANSHSSLSKAYRKLGDFSKALQHYEAYVELNTALIADVQTQSVNSLQTKFDVKQQQEKIKLLTAENQINTLLVTKANQQRIEVIAGSLALIIIILLFVRNRYRAKEAERLKQHNIEIAHNQKRLALLSNVFKSTSDAVFITDPKFNIEAVNKALVAITGYEEAQILNKPISRALSYLPSTSLITKVFNQLKNDTSWQGELSVESASGKPYPIELKMEAVFNDDKQITHYIGVFTDITLKQEAQLTLEKLATHDELTGLPNRALFKQLLEQSLINSQTDDKLPAVLTLDISGFKKINDSYGHDIGDTVIKYVAKTIADTLYPKDVIARLSGDEFAILLSLKDAKHGAIIVANKLHRAFHSVCEIETIKLNIKLNIGIALISDEAVETEDLLKNSAIALLDCKSIPEQYFNFYESHMNIEAAEQLALEQQILHAIEQDEFSFYYQPLINTQSGKISGAEALIRWVKSDGSIIYPDQFIPAAEQAGLIDKIDLIVVDKNIKQLAKWQKSGQIVGPVSLNLSATIFSQPEMLMNYLKEKLSKYQVDAKLIKLEITEGMLLNNIELAIKTMKQLKILGFKLALDDFGTGFSSLNYLKQFPIDILKIDRSFVMDIDQSPTDQSIVKSIIDLATNLNLTVVAEGVETQAHLSLLAEMNCQEYQGYYFSKPLELKSFEQLVVTHREASITES